MAPLSPGPRPVSPIHVDDVCRALPDVDLGPSRAAMAALERCAPVTSGLADVISRLDLPQAAADTFAASAFAAGSLPRLAESLVGPNTGIIGSLRAVAEQNGLAASLFASPVLGLTDQITRLGMDGGGMQTSALTRLGAELDAQYSFARDALKGTALESMASTMLAATVAPPDWFADSSFLRANSLLESLRLQHTSFAAGLFSDLAGSPGLLAGLADTAAARVATMTPGVASAELSAVVSEELARALGSGTASAVAPGTVPAVDPLAAVSGRDPSPSVGADTTGVSSGAGTLAVLALCVAAHVVQRVPSLPPDAQRELLTQVWEALLQVTLFVLAARSAGRDHTAQMAALGGIADTLKAALPPTAYITVRPVAVRAEASGKAPRVATIAAGCRVTVRDRVGRWMYVELADRAADGVPTAGWVYLRGLRPLP